MKKIAIITSICMGLFFMNSQMGYAQVSTGPKNNTRSTTQGTNTRQDNNDRDRNNSILPNNNNRNISNEKAPTQFDRANVGRISRNTIDYNRNSNTNNRLFRNDMPTGYERLQDRNNRNYYYYDGRYYTQNNGRYMEVQPILGLRVNRIPSNHNRISYNRNTYYYYNGVFYTFQRNFYEVVAPPIGLIVNSIPVNSERIYIYGQVYYEYYGIIFMKQGRRYQVVGYLD